MTARRLGWLRSGNASLLSAAFVLTVAPRVSRAAQFVLFDATFPYTWNDAMNSSPSKSHYYVNEGNGSTRRAPRIAEPVNYRDGIGAHPRRGDRKARGRTNGRMGALLRRQRGQLRVPVYALLHAARVYERDVDMHSFFNNDTINWAQASSKSISCTPSTTAARDTSRTSPISKISRPPPRSASR
jgi:hypothetical protein